MKPNRPFPTEPPFLSVYTTTYRRPQALERNMSSVARQTAVERIEHLIVPDHVGYGIPNGLYGRLRWYGPALRGKYVAMLCDDDELAREDVVERVMALAKGEPEVIIVRALKGITDQPRAVREDYLTAFPKYREGTEPQEGESDLCCFIVRRDIWLKHLADFGDRYQGDWDFAVALHRAGYRHVWGDFVFAVGSNSNGRPEAVAW